MLRRLVKKSVGIGRQVGRRIIHKDTLEKTDEGAAGFSTSSASSEAPLVTGGVQIGRKPSERPREGLPPRNPSESPESFIQQAIETHPVLLFVKGTPSAPACGFSAQTMGIFQRLGKPFQTFNVLEDNDVREAVKEFSQWPTLPQVYIRGEFVGGCDIITQLYENGDLAAMLEAEA